MPSLRHLRLHFERIFAAGPADRKALSNDERLQSLAAARWFPRLRTLRLEAWPGAAVGPGGAEAPCLESLSLGVASVDGGAAAVASIGRLRLPVLRCLDLDLSSCVWCLPPDALAAALAAPGLAGALQELGFTRSHGCDLGRDTWHKETPFAAAAGAPLRALRALKLVDSPEAMGAAAAALAGGCEWAPRLTRLCLVDSTFSFFHHDREHIPVFAAAGAAFAAAPLTGLRSLSVSGWRPPGEALRAPLAAPWLSGLGELDLPHVAAADLPALHAASPALAALLGAGRARFDKDLIAELMAARRTS